MKSVATTLAAALLLFLLAPAPASAQVTLSTGGGTVAPGGQITVPVTVEDGFTDLTSMQFTLTWDVQTLGYEALAFDGNPLGLGGDNFGDPEERDDPDALTFVWSSASGTDLAPGQTLFSVTFRAAEGASTGVSFDGSVTSVYASNADNENVVFTGQAGTVTVGQGGGSGGAPSATLSSMTAEARDGEVLLRWETASETNSGGFRVESRREEGAPGA